MTQTQRIAERRAELVEQLNELQRWFAARPYGFRERATPEQLQMFRDREAEQERIADALEELEGL